MGHAVGSLSPLGRTFGAGVIGMIAAVSVLAHADPTWHITRPVIKNSGTNALPPEPSNAPVAAPLRKEEAREQEEFTRITIERIFVEGLADPESRQPRPQTVEQRFANALNRGNPEVAGGKIRHGTFYDGFVYWGSDPLSFVWLNVVNRLRD
jgi:hypothetical protein